MATPEQPVAPAPAPAPQPYKPSSAATLAAAGQGATAASHAAVTPTLVAAGVQARAIAEATGRIVDALTSFSTKRRQTIIPILQATLVESFTDRTPSEISMLLGKEQAREREFLRRQAMRIARDMPKVLAESDLDLRREAMRKLMRREQRYMAQRERAMTARAHAAVESLDLEEASPEGAYWMLGGPVHKHTPGCVAMANRFWPWPVLRDVIHPPVHPGCPCSLISLDEAVMRGFMTHEQLPDVKDALLRARRNMALEEAIAETYPAWQIADEMAMLELEDLEEAAVNAHRGDGHHSPQLRFAKGLVKGGQFMPKLGTSDRVKTKTLVPHVHHPKPATGRTLGRSVYLQGNRVHIPEARTFSRHVGGNHYTSPAGSTNVYRNGKLASTPDAPSMHADFERPRKGTKKGSVTAKGKETPQSIRDAEKARAERSGKRVERAVGAASKDVSPVHEGDSAHTAHKALAKGGFKHDEAGTKTTTNTLVVPYSHKDGHELTVTYDRHTSKVRSATWKPAKKADEPPPKKAEAAKPAKDVAAPEKGTRTPPRPRSEPKPDATLGTGDQAWSRQLDRAQAGDAHAQWDLQAEAAARGPKSDFAKRLKDTVGADVLRRWRDGSRWPGPVPQGEAPARYQVAHVSGGEHGPAVGVAMHSVAAGRPGDAGRSFGTGRYFTSGQAGEDGQGLSLAGAHLHRARDTAQARSLGHALAILNGIAEGNGESVQMQDPQTGEMRHYTLDHVLAHLPDGMARRDSRLFAEHAIAMHQAGHDESAATHLMRAHGYDGVDNRHLPALDVPAVGSVVYAPQGRDGEHSPETPGLQGEASPAQGGAVVRGVVGRWVWVRGRYTHVPQDAAWSETVDGVKFSSPAGGTAVFRKAPGDSTELGELVSGPGVRARHADVRNPRTGGTARGATAGATVAPEAPPAPEVPPVTPAVPEVPRARNGPDGHGLYINDDRRRSLLDSGTTVGVSHSDSQLEPVNLSGLARMEGDTRGGHIVTGGPWQRMTPNERQYALDHEYGRDLASAVDNDHVARDEMGSLWTGGHFTDDQGQHVDRYSAPAAVAAVYAQMNSDNWPVFAGRYPDASRWVATQAQNRRYHVRPDVKEWIDGPQTGNVHDPVGELPGDARRLAQSTVGQNIDAAHGILGRAGYTRSPMTDGGTSVFRKVDPENHHVLTIALTGRSQIQTADGTAYGFDPNQVPAEGDTPERHAYEVRGQTFAESQSSLADRGYFPMNTAYGGNGRDTVQTWVRPDSATALVVTSGSSPQHVDRRVLDARPTVLNAAEERARLTAVAKDRPDLALPGLLHNDTSRIVSGTNWRTDASRADPGNPSTFTYDLVRNTDAENPATASHDAWRVEVRSVGGQDVVARVGRPGLQEGSFAADDAEWQGKREATIHEMRTLAAARRARIDSAKDLVRSETNAGRAPDLANMQASDVRVALRELGYADSAPRDLRSGQSVTWTNRETGTRMSVRMGPSTTRDQYGRTDGPVVSSRLLTRGAPDHGRDRMPEGLAPATLEQLHADVLGYSDELAARHGGQTDLRSVRTDPALGGMSGEHRQWEGSVRLGTSVEPAIQRALEARHGGAPLGQRERQQAITAYRTLAHEMIHGIHGERGLDAYNAEDGGKGIEESLTSELEVEAAYDLMRRHGHADLLAEARTNGQRTQVYQRHRENFRALLSDMGLDSAGPDQLRTLFNQWKFKDTDEERRDDFARRIAEHRGVSTDDAHALVVTRMQADNERGNETVAVPFRPILTTTVPQPLAGTAPPAPPTPPTPPTPPVTPSGPTASLSDGGKVTVGARVRGNSTGQLATVTGVEGSQITVRRDDGSTATYGGDQYSSVAVTDSGMVLAARDYVRLPSGEEVRLRSVNWSDPQSPMAQVTMDDGTSRTVPMRTLRSRTGNAWSLPMTRRDGSAMEATEGTAVTLADGRTATLAGSTLSSWPTGDLTYTAVLADGSRVSVPREGITGLAGELPRPPRAGVGQLQTGTELSLAHFNRQDGSDPAGTLGNWLAASVGAPAVEQWARANDVSLRGETGDQAIARTYRNAFASKAANDETRTMNPKLYEGTMQLAREAGLPTPNWDTRVAPGTTAVPAGEITEEHVARAIFTGTFGRAGHTTQVVSASASGRGISIEGRVMDASGSQVGRFTRRVTRNADGSFGVYNAYLKLNGAAQGTGFASAFNRHCFDQYRQKGVREVTVSANIDVGGYTWAATGFDFQVTSSDQQRRAEERAKKAYSLAFSAKQNGKITDAEWQQIKPKLWSGDFVGQPLTDQHVQHAWELAHIDGRPAGSRRGQKNIGQKILLGTSWSGVRLMDAPDPTAPAAPAAPEAPVAPAAAGTGALPLSTTRPAGTTATARLRSAERTFAGANRISSRVVREAVSDVAEIIEAAHPGLVTRRPTVSVGAMTRRGAAAEYGLDGTITLATRPSRARRSMDLAHEYGHHIDNYILGRIGGGPGSAELAAFRQAVRDSGVLDRLAAYGRRGSGGSPSYARYASAGDEVWARAYARWVASKSDNPRIQAEAEQVSRQMGDWPGDSFAPIAASIDALFAALQRR